MFYIHCDNKGCGEHQAPNLDTDTNEVICSECGKPITNVTVFFKTQLKSFGQIVRSGKKQQAYTVQCKKCQKAGQPILDEKGIEILCSHCKEPFGDALSRPFKSAILEFLKASRNG